MKSTPGVSESLLSRAQLFEILRRFRARVFLQLDDDAAQSFERAVARQFQVEVHFRVALFVVVVFVDEEALLESFETLELFDDDIWDDEKKTTTKKKKTTTTTKPHLVHRQRNGVRDVVAFRQSDDVFHGRATIPPGNGQHASHSIVV